MCEDWVKSRADCILYRPIGPVYKLKRVQGGGQDGFNVGHDQPLEALHDDRCQCHGAIIIEAGWSRLLWHGDDGGGLERQPVSEVC